MKKDNKFIFVKHNINIIDKPLIEKDDVGVIEREFNEKTSIFFIRIWQEIILNNEDFQIFDVKKTGDGFSKKICNVCHKLLDTTDFAKNQNGKDNRTVRRPSCQECRKEIDGLNMSASEKNKWLLKKPHNEPFQCPICGKKTIADLTSKIVLDHDHNTGLGRGWICDSCNTGIGRFKDDINLIKRAIKFLE